MEVTSKKKILWIVVGLVLTFILGAVLASVVVSSHFNNKLRAADAQYFQLQQDNAKRIDRLSESINSQKQVIDRVEGITNTMEALVQQDTSSIQQGFAVLSYLRGCVQELRRIVGDEQ
jgi:peptidoglycan hydrolase CwlO-like protein